MKHSFKKKKVKKLVPGDLIEIKTDYDSTKLSLIIAIEKLKFLNNVEDVYLIIHVINGKFLLQENENTIHYTGKFWKFEDNCDSYDFFELNFETLECEYR